jgi:hypothetical protein
LSIKFLFYLSIVILDAKSRMFEDNFERLYQNYGIHSALHRSNKRI